jgi:Bacterial PH domain
MADLKVKHLEDQLKRIGCNFRFWGRAELKELADILLPDEIVEHCVNGQYERGFAMLVATNQRVLLIDKKPMYLSLEDVRFDMISEIDYNHRMLNATVFICTLNKALSFTAYNHGRLRKLFHYVQTQVMEIRQHYQQQSKLWKEYAENLQSQQPGGLPPMAREAVEASPAPGQIPSPDVAGQLSFDYETTKQTSPAPQLQAPPMQFRAAPLINAYTRLPMMSRQRRFLGSRALVHRYDNS